MICPSCRNMFDTCEVCWGNGYLPDPPPVATQIPRVETLPPNSITEITTTRYEQQGRDLVSIETTTRITKNG